jgi:tetratricopeptide (TPR) repeat protein/tRNA A-37 threonylcarbamoyl transferase component Bud32
VNDDRWTRIDDLFHRAIALPPAERERFLVEVAAGDADLATKVRRLVRAHGEAGADFLGRPPLGSAATIGTDEGVPAIGRRIGPYRILREIGRGGMGAVYLAERADAQYEKRLALKLVQRGMDSDSVLRRFLAERQILASMDHPNIARLLDGGTTDDGRPYFVMELVEGQPIDDYADANGLDIEARLELFRQVCAAVSYAHQRLVIHRDLKPSNILVAADGTAKLLDFGIARILGTDDPDTPSTVTVLGLMTPEYASPEQIQGRHATTLSDVYALGLILYRLLTGAAPYRFESRSPEAMARIIADVEPARPSTTGTGTRRLRGDLDNIVLKALQKDPARRYSSVDQFSEDIRRHLAGLPVLARPDTLGYRTAKFVRRNRVAVAGAAIVFTTLVGGIVATSWQARRAREQEALARSEQARAERRFQDVRQLARTVLFDYHDLIKDLPGATPVRERLLRDATTYLELLSREAGSDTGLISELAHAYERVGDVQRVAGFADSGNTIGAQASYRRALELFEARLAVTPRDVVARRDVASLHAKLGQLNRERGRTGEALRLYRMAIDEYRALATENPTNDDLWQRLAGSQDYAGLILQDRGEIDAAIEAFRAAIASFRALSDQGSVLARHSIATGQEHLASALVAGGRLEEALVSIRESIDNWSGLIRDAPDVPGHQRAIGVCYYFEGEILAGLGRTEAALASHRRNLAITERLAGQDSTNSLFRGDQGYALVRVGDLLLELNRLPEALTHYEKSRVLRQADATGDPANLWKRSCLIESNAKLALARARVGEEAASTEARRRALALIQDTDVEPRNAIIRGFLAQTYAELGEACARLAEDRRIDASRRADHWREATDLYRKSADIWSDMESLGIVSPIDAEKPARVAQELARCEAALGASRRG